MGVTGLLPFLQKASRPAKMKEFAGLNLNVCWLLADKDRVHIVLVQGQPLLLTSMSGFTRVLSGAILLYRDARKLCHFSNQPSVCVVVLRLWRRVNQLMPTWNMLWGELGVVLLVADWMDILLHQARCCHCCCRCYSRFHCRCCLCGMKWLVVSRWVDMLLHFNIKPVLVFDGRNLPSKAQTEKKRRVRRLKQNCLDKWCFPW